MVICFVGFTVARFHGQAAPTADRVGDLQIGAMFNLADTDYRPEKFKGYGFYSTYDFTYHIGIEGEFHQINDPDATEGIYERTYEIGPRYVLHYGRFAPYAKIMYGRGVFNYPRVFGDPKIGPIANLAYNIFAIGGGVDYHVLPGLNARAEYEYQQWLSFAPNGLTPKIFSVGAAYRFH
jgi:opacity protein-like surface antigen